MNPQLTAFSLSSQASAQGSLSHGNLSRIKTARPVASLVESLRMSREKARLDRLRCGSARSKHSTPIRSLNITPDNITLMSKHSPDGTQVSSKSDQQVTPAPEVVEKLKMQVFELEQRLQDVKRTTNGISELEACHEKLAQECSTRKASHCSSEMQLMKEELALKNTLLLKREEAKEVSTQPPIYSNDDLHEQLAQKDALLRQRESELSTKDATLVAMRAENSALREKAQRDVGQKEIGDGRSETCVCCNTLSTEVDCLRTKLKDMAAKLAKVPARVKSSCDSDEKFAEFRKQLETKDMTIRILENRLTREKTETQSAIRRLERARPNSPSRRPESRAGSPLPSDPGRKDRLARSIRKYYQYSVDGASMTTPGYPKSETVFEDETRSNISLASSKPMFAAFPKTEFLYRQCHKSAASNQNSPSQTAALDPKLASVLSAKDGDQTVLTSAPAEVKDADVFATSAGSGPEKSNYSPPRVDTAGLSQVEVGPDIPPVSISPANDGADGGSYNHAAVDIGLIANYTSDSFENGNIEALGKVYGSQDILGNHGPAGPSDLFANSSGHFHISTDDNPRNDPLSKEYCNDQDAVGPFGYVNGSGNASHSSAHPSNSHPASHKNNPGPISNNRGPTDTTAVSEGDTAALFGGTADTAALFTGTAAGDTAALFEGTADTAALFTGTAAGDAAALCGSTTAPVVAVDTPSLFEGTAAPIAGDTAALFEAIAAPVPGDTAALFTGTSVPVAGDTAALFTGAAAPVVGDTGALFTGISVPVAGDTAALFAGTAAPVVGDTAATLWTGTSVPVAGDAAKLFEDTAGPVAGDTAALFAGDTAALFGSTDAPFSGDSAALFTGTSFPVAGNAARFTGTPAPVAGDTAALFGGDNDLPDIPGLFGASGPNLNPGHHFATTGNNAVTATEVYNPSGATISFAQSQAYVDTRDTPSTAPVVPARIVQAAPARNVQNAPFQAKPNAIDSLFNAHNEEDDFFSKMCADNEANKAVSEAFKLSANPQPFSEKSMPLAGAESGFNRANLTSTSQTRDSAQFPFRTHPHDATTPFGFSTANTSFGSQPYHAATVYTPATRDPGFQEISSATHVPAQPTHVPAQQFPAQSYPSVSAFQPATLAPAKSKPAISGDVSSLFD